MFELLIVFLVWSLPSVLTLLGVIWTTKHINKKPLYLDAPFNLYPISILKPLKGKDADLKSNLTSFFEQKYPEFELIFSVSSHRDPAIPIVNELMSLYPRVKSKLIIGEVELGPNPKINNLVKSYEIASHDWIIISDSNTRVSSDFLKRVVGHLDATIGVMTALIVGTDAKGIGGHLEANYLNTFYSRFMVLAERFKQPCVVGKCMVLRRSVANRFGGVKTLAKFIAEDYMTGKAMKMLGMKVAILSDPIEQPIGIYSFKSFWKRHLRWGRIRKSHAPIIFLFEPIAGALIPALCGAYLFEKLNMLSFFEVFAGQVLIHYFLDSYQVFKLQKKFSIKESLAWFLREALVLILWIHTLLGRTVEWRGQKLLIKQGGLTEIV